ncbi:MAG: SGNH/GDSL hydrolase family protein [Deltaproteobacteria bacterium]|nr:SGNH/GDSL hydrolase family protein [Deltaproteobacteria bacterium]
MNIFKSDSVIGFTYKPNAKTYEKGREYNALYQINSLGLRDREYGPKENGIFRVLLVGDSFSASHGLPIEDSLSRQLERSLQTVVNLEEMPVKIEVINAAHGGYSPYNYWKAYRRWKSLFKPDVVIVGLSPDDYDCKNEYSQYLIEGGVTLAVYKNGREPKRREKSSIRKLRKWLSWNSESYILMRNYLYYNDLVGRISLWMSAKGEERNTQLQQYEVPQPESMKMAWTKTFSYLQKLQKETAADGVTLIVAPLPLKLEIDPEQYRKDLASSGLKPQQIDIDQPLKEISAFCEEENIPVLDPREAIRKRHAEVPCYFVYDGHWIVEGIRVATASLVRQWRDRGLPPWDTSMLYEAGR